MRLGEGPGACHLTYCTNIHPGESWDQVRANLSEHVVPVRDAIGPSGPFGLGLRLSGVAADALGEPETFDDLRAFLAAEDMYVFTINGFPYGPFHGTRVKEEVYLPDWSDPERLRYTNRLADLLSQLVPEGELGSVSTVPGTFRPRADAARIATIANRMIDHAAHLVELERRTGRTIALAVEPEPCCMIETVAEAISFFTDHLFGEAARARLGGLTGLAPAAADEALRRHLTLCLDTCHAAVEFEDPAGCLAALDRAGVAVSKIQISAGLHLDDATPARAGRLETFADDVYLHQVVACRAGHLDRWADLPEALASLDDTGDPPRWRVHFHVPLFLGDLGEGLRTTRDFTAEVLGAQRERGIAPHLEVETYTWDVLPAEHRDRPVAEAVARELEWARGQLVG